jgi:hypothetical protein
VQLSSSADSRGVQGCDGLYGSWRGSLVSVMPLSKKKWKEQGWRKVIFRAETVCRISCCVQLLGESFPSPCWLIVCTLLYSPWGVDCIAPGMLSV